MGCRLISAVVNIYNKHPTTTTTKMSAPMFCKKISKILSFSSKSSLNLSNKVFVQYRRWCSVRVGQTAELTKVFTPSDVQKFADISLDTNPVHTDPEFAKANSRFGACIVHGLLINGYLTLCIKICKIGSYFYCKLNQIGLGLALFCMAMPMVST
jgi:hypothetical protein